jgi:hypothetical protein
MKTKGFWIHKNSMDVFYQVLKVYDIHPEYIKVKYRCWNKGQCGVPYLLDGLYYFKAKVMKDDLKNWRRYDFAA